jgi:hypothetical protein
MKSILIGSRALDYWHDLQLCKPATDFDVISAFPIEGTEWHDRWLLNNDSFDEFTSEEHTLDFHGHKLYVMNLQGLAIIKRSHLWRDLSFDKHITHYHKHLARYLPPNDKLLLERLEQTYKAFPQQGPDLRKSKQEFFDDAVTKKYDHDYLHELVAYEQHPMYTKLQKGEDTVKCYKELWYNLSYTQQLQCVQEETYVLAIERFLVPSDWEYPVKLAYLNALKKVCTTVCSGWFRDFAIDNYAYLIEGFDEGKVQKIRQQLERK